jgi:hypothetical protein
MPRHKITTDPVTTHTHDWADVTGEPSTYPPSAHTHAWTDVTGKPTTFAPSAHNHAAADINSGTLSVERVTPTVGLFVFKSSGGAWPARPTARTDVTVCWVGAAPDPTDMLAGKDLRFISP